MISVPSKPDMRPAFSMIMAIFVIVIMASVGAFVLNLSGKMIQETTTQYRQEQAILYAKSYTEYAIMAATAQSCIKNINSNIDGNTPQVKNGQGYRIKVEVKYLGTNSGCSGQIGPGILSNPGTIIVVDVYVRYRDPELPASVLSKTWSQYLGTTYHRRTIQRL